MSNTFLKRGIKSILASVLLIQSFAATTPSVTLEDAPVFDKHQLTCLVRNAYFEARGEDTTGRLLVTQVVLNRAAKHNKSWCAVIHAPKQFSWTAQKPRRVPLYAERILREEILHYLTGYLYVPVEMEGATHFHATYVRPSWSGRLRRLGQHHNHIFYGER